MRREIRFLKWGTSYLPIHWKGFAVMALVIVPAFVIIMAGQAFLRHLGYGSFGGLLLMATICLALLILFPIARRHS